MRARVFSQEGKPTTQRLSSIGMSGRLFSNFRASADRVSERRLWSLDRKAAPARETAAAAAPGSNYNDHERGYCLRAAGDGSEKKRRRADRVRERL